jgi:3-methyladenine DNA glycosylase/8-oxoguanine DNA glycosylase
MSEPVTREWHAPWPVDLDLVLGSLRRGGDDPAYRREAAGAIWRTMRTPDGPATQRLELRAGRAVSTSWGPGAEWAAERMPRMLGADDDVSGFDASLHPLVREQWRRLAAALRFPAVGCTVEVLIAAVLEQRVTGREARRAWRWLLRTYGEPAPGPSPDGMRVVPAPGVVAAVPSWEWHRAGVDGTRADTLMRAMSYAGRIAQCDDLPVEQARARLQALPGIGVWTSAEVAARSFGDADAVSFGDVHVAPNVVYALTSETTGDDARLAEVLEPWRGHRGRVVRLVELTGISRPARGPRYSPKDFRAM